MAVALAVGLLALELGLRGWLALDGSGGHDAGRVRARLELLLGPLRASAVWSRAADPADDDAAGRPGDRFLHPYLGYDTRAGSDELAWELDFLARGGLAALEAETDAYFVLLVGGSQARQFGLAARGGAERLVELLGADPRLADRRVVVLDHGRPAYKQPQQVMLVAWLVALGFRPDAVLDLDGFNELALATLNAEAGVNPLFPNHAYWTQLAGGRGLDAGRVDAAAAVVERAADGARFAELAADLGLARSALAGTLAVRRAQSLREAFDAAEAAWRALEAEATDPRVLRGPPFDADRVLDDAVAAWERGSRELHALCNGLGIFYLHALQPALHDEGAKPLSPAERERADAPASVVAAIRAGYPRLRAAGERLAASGVPFVDASRVFTDVTETIYDDPVHFGRPGTELLADAIAAGFLAHLPPR